MLLKTLFRNCRSAGIAGVLLSALLLAQPQDRLRARDLFLAGPASSSSGETIGSGAGRRPLGLRYSILKQVNGQTVEVDPDSVFRSGDRIRLTVQANDTGYLYIVLRGSSGKWTPLFPSKEIMSGDNKVERGGQYEIPLGSVWFAFDEQAGTEKLFIVLARQPVPDFEKLVQSLRQNSPQEGGKEKASSTGGEKGSVQVVASLDDATVGKVRGQVRGRDLVFEKVDESAPIGSKKEKAVYVVNQTSSPDSKVVVDVSLNHQ